MDHVQHDAAREANPMNPSPVTSSRKIQSPLIPRDAAEVARSFMAGALYMAAIGVLGGVAVQGAKGLSETALPQLVESIAPTKFPKYSAHDLNRAERWNPERWNTDTVIEPGVDKLASSDVSGSAIR